MKNLQQGHMEAGLHNKGIRVGVVEEQGESAGMHVPVEQ
jgi:hypothetical protein